MCFFKWLSLSPAPPVTPAVQESVAKLGGLYLRYRDAVRRETVEAIAAERARSVADALAALTDEPRVEAMAPYCSYCGRPAPHKCPCTCDD